jgi:hypothetical protein
MSNRRPLNAIRHEVDQFKVLSEGGNWQWAVVRRARDLIGVSALEVAVGSNSSGPDQQGLSSMMTDLQQQVAELSQRLVVCNEELRFAEERFVLADYLKTVPLSRTPLISVVLATKAERPGALRQAIASVFSQSYDRFEIVLVTTEPVDLGIHTGDQRIVLVIEPRPGISLARNVGLAAASGEFIVYADDDNTMAPHWLRSVVWALTTRGDIDVVYGARVHESVSGPMQWPPAFWHFERSWNPEVLQRFSAIDTQVLGHRAGLEEARWDESIPACVDWELATRITSSGRVLPLPVHACTYTTAAPSRITDEFNTPALRATIAGLAKKRRRLRLLSVVHAYPRHSESYVESELIALRSRFDISIATEWGPSAAQPDAVTAFPVFASVAEAIDRFQPEVALIHFADVAQRFQHVFQSAGIPYAVRSHSYDFEIAKAVAATVDPLRLALWVYPEYLESIPGALALPSLLHEAQEIPPSPGVRSGVVLASSALIKRRWPEILQLFASLVGIPRTMFLGESHGSQALPGELRVQAARIDPLINVQLDAKPLEIMRALTVTNTLIYDRPETHPVGNPRSVIEAWACGAIPVLPDHPECRRFAGDHARYFTSYTGASELIRELEECSASLGKERDANREYAIERFAHPDVHQRFANEFAELAASFLG